MSDDKDKKQQDESIQSGNSQSIRNREALENFSGREVILANEKPKNDGTNSTGPRAQKDDSDDER